MNILLSLPVLIALIAVALSFDFLNGLHDAANSIATLVSTRMLRPRYAVLWAAFFNFIAFLFFGVHVARHRRRRHHRPPMSMDARVIFGALMGAIVWNLITWWGGIPSSSSHALIGGLVGAGVTKAGFASIVWPGADHDRRLHRAVAAAWVSFWPCCDVLVSWRSCAPTRARSTGTFRWLQFASASLISLGHGGNDAQKTMGIIAVLLSRKALLRPFLRAVLGGALLPGGDGAGHADRRLAHRQHPRIEDHPAHAGAGFLCRGRRATLLFVATFFGIPFRPPIRSPARSSGSALPARFRRCAGISPGTSLSPGLSRCRRRRWSLHCSTGCRGLRSERGAFADDPRFAAISARKPPGTPSNRISARAATPRLRSWRCRKR